MGDMLLGITLVVAILGGAAVVTQLFVRAMYISCGQCRSLNARRRARCRRCGAELMRS